MKISVIITLKKDVLDPQGKVIHQTLDGMGFENVNEVRQGKYFEIDTKESDKDNAKAKVEEMCKKLLANLVIENYKIILSKKKTIMKISVIITLKKDVLDPQGKVIQQTLDGMGFNGINEVRQGKYFEIDVKENDPNKAKKIVEEMCKKLLANLVIENYKIIGTQ